MSFCAYGDGDICDPPFGPTIGHEDCWTGMENWQDYGDADGIGCDVGCASCRDLPYQVSLQGSIPLTKLFGVPGEGPALLGAGRFLYPHLDSPSERVGANNTQFVLQASVPEWVKPGAKFHLGCCFGNVAHECFGAWSTCSCFNEASGVIDISGHCPDGTALYHLLSGLFMDRFAYAGLGWPLIGIGTHGLYGKSFHCRKFTPIQTCSQTVTAIPAGGIYSALGRMPTILRTSQGETGAEGETGTSWGCAISTFVFLVGRAAHNSDCLDGYASEGGDQNHQEGRRYIAADNQCANAAVEIRCVPDPIDPPKFLDSENFPHADRKTYELNNTVLDMIWDRQWPDNGQPGGSMNFDFLDHGVPNEGMGKFGRSYQPTLETLEWPDYVSVKELPQSHAQWGDLNVNASLIIAGINISLVYTPVKIHRQPAGDWRKTYMAYPFAAVDIEVTYGIRINSFSGTGFITRRWLDPPVMIPVVTTIGAPGTFPTISPDGNRLVYVDEDGEVFDPPAHFSWTGLLSRLTKPSSDEQAKVYLVVEGRSETQWAQDFLEASSGAYVAGQPALLETNPDSPNQLWGGQLLITFEGTAGWNQCME